VTITPRKRIAVHPAPSDPRIVRLLGCLSAAFEVDFVPIAKPEDLREDAVLLLADDDASQLRKLASFPAVFSAPAPRPEAGKASAPIRFSADKALAASFRGETLVGEISSDLRVIEVSGMVPLAQAGDRPVWLVRAESPGLFHCRVNLPLTGLAAAEEIIDGLQESEFISLLPLVDFVRRVSAEHAWVRPGLRATLIIDDPNLHSPRYGYIDYARLAERARQVGFHACMATIPFDGWYVNPQAAKIFRDFRDVLSLTVHGNDHEAKELARAVSADEAARVVAQAVARTEAIERESGLAVARVMVPPHGACSGVYLEALARAGFLGATTTRGAVWEHSDGRERQPGSGMALAEIVHGLPIIHRFRFNSDRWRHRVAVSAYLEHPLLAYGHHGDFSGGLDAFDEVARRITDLGATWVSPADLFATNFETRLESRTRWVRPFSRQVVVPAETADAELRCDLGEFADAILSTNIYSSGNSPVDRRLTPNVAANVSVVYSRRIAIRVASSNPIDSLVTPARRTLVSSAARRLLSEGRDRWGGYRG